MKKKEIIDSNKRKEIEREKEKEIKSDNFTNIAENKINNICHKNDNRNESIITQDVDDKEKEEIQKEREKLTENTPEVRQEVSYEIN